MASGEIVAYLTRHGNAARGPHVLPRQRRRALTQTADNPNGMPQSTFEALRACWVRTFRDGLPTTQHRFSSRKPPRDDANAGGRQMMLCPVRLRSHATKH